MSKDEGLRHTQIEYWIKKGFSITESKEKIDSFFKKRNQPFHKEFHAEELGIIDDYSEENTVYIRTGNWKNRSGKDDIRLSSKKEFFKYIEDQILIQNFKRWTDLTKQELELVYEEFLGFSVSRTTFNKVILNVYNFLPFGQKTNILSDFYWWTRGWSIFEAMKKVEKLQKERSQRNIEYWIKKGYKEEQAANKISELQRRNSQLSLKKGTYSKESIVFFKKEILPFFNEKEILWKENEKLLKYRKDCFFYDFCIEEYKIIFEYHGISFHPKLNFSEKEKKNWKNALSKHSFERCFQRDRFKRKLAEENGYKFFEIWSDYTEKELKDIKDELRNYIETRRAN